MSSVRPDLAVAPIRALVAGYRQIDGAKLEDVYLGCANQAGENDRNVARMALLLAGLLREVPSATSNRLCGSGMDAAGIAGWQLASYALATLCIGVGQGIATVIETSVLPG